MRDVLDKSISSSCPIPAETWLAAVVFQRNRVEKITAWLMVANEVYSLVGGFFSAAHLGWVMTTPGMINYIVWNVLVLFMSIFFWLSLRKRLAQINHRSTSSETVNAMVSQSG